MVSLYSAVTYPLVHGADTWQFVTAGKARCRAAILKRGKPMQLSQFISESLQQIFVGINGAKETASQHGFQINPWFSGGISDTAGQLVDRETKTLVRLVEFDVAVTTAESEQSKGGAGLLVAGLGIGGQLQSGATNSVVSRLKFTVPVALPRASEKPTSGAAESLNEAFAESH